MKKYLNFIVGAVCCALVGLLYYYVVLPPINLHSVATWSFFVVLIIAFAVPFGILSAMKTVIAKVGKKKSEVRVAPTVKVLLILMCVPIAVCIIGGIASSTFFNAHRYASVITVEEAVFEEDMPETTNVTNIALMDSDSARIIGNRTLGSLSDVVSQYEAGYTYNQINYNGAPKKVTSLEYVDFFKWMGNRKSGIPGYIMVDPVNNNASYEKLEKPIKYVSSAYFNDKLERRLRFSYPTKIFGSFSFEIDEEGDPYYVVSCLKPRVGLFGAMDVNEVIIFDPCTGDSEIYPVSDVPSWVDEVYDGNLAMNKYNWHGMYSGGYWNSIVGNKDCKTTTDDFGYIAIGDDVWYFTGVTSITSDESNIGFIITNARTGEYKFYPVVGAEEYSAMAAARGEVQEKGYEASFPSLINVSGKATYILVLKDNGGLVKLYALVNVENYGIVATGETQHEAMKAYRKLLSQNGINANDSPESDNQPMECIGVDDVQTATVGGETYIYIISGEKTGERALYKSPISDDETLLLIRPHDNIEVRYTEGEDGVRYIDSWKWVTVEEQPKDDVPVNTEDGNDTASPEAK